PVISLSELKDQITIGLTKHEYTNVVSLAEKYLSQYSRQKDFQPTTVKSEDITLAGQLITLASTHTLTAQAYNSLKNYQKSLKHLKAALRIYQQLNSRANIATVFSCMGLIFQRKGNLNTAEKYFNDAIEIETKINTPNIWQTYYFLAQLYEKRSDSLSAQRYYRNAIAKIESVRGGLNTSETKLGFLATAVRPFHDYVAFLMEHRPVPNFYLEALEITERVRARVLTDLVAGKPGLISSSGDINWNYSGADFDEQDNRQLAEPWSYNRIIDFVKKGDTLYISYFITEKSVYAFLITPAGKVSWTKLGFSKAELSDLVKDYLYYIDNGLSTTRNLFANLIGPLGSTLHAYPQITKITILPHEDLNLIPFATLFDPQKQRYFSDDYQLSYLPCFTITEAFNSINTNTQENILIIGKPSGTIGLMHSESEVKNVAQLFTGRAKVLIGEAATKLNVRDEIEHYNLVLFSTHATPDRLDQNISLELASGERLTRKDIEKIKLKARLIVLSACQTHIGERYAGDELMSLARAFVSSGAKYVLASLWQVEDQASSEIVQYFFNFLQSGFSPTQSLQRAQLRYRELNAGKEKARQRAYFWGAWVLIGKN
ncbi:MAG: CHAT domain-containing tetratricopeptide repeat protein, partial [Acidobacteriota bacterium]